MNIDSAKKVHTIYFSSCEFPKWVLEPSEWQNHRFAETKLYYMKTDILNDVQRMITEREPCNIGMRRFYDENTLEKEFGWRHGAYEQSSEDKLMPNIAVYCHATVKRPYGNILVHVINLVGYAFDSPKQPDFIYFHTKPKEELIKKYNELWQKALAAAKDLKAEGKINKIRLFNVGGGAFAGQHQQDFISTIFEPAFKPLMSEFTKAGIQVLGFENVFIPDLLDKAEEDVAHTLYVNAWDPWSLIGNGNERDRSLDGYWGRCSNMAVLGWARTNPHILYIGIDSI